ncbi:MAG: DMT family transporter, partial [Proteobacteria bacterium]|nr:DMT family transporter [Pseudomonadota bacterium]
MTRKFLDGFGILILAQLMVSINIVGSKYLLPTIPILLLLTLRFLLSAGLLLPLHWVTKKNSGYQDLKTLNKKDWLFILAQALSAGVFFNGLMLLGLNYTSANAAGIITSALPAIIAVMSFLILKEYFSKRKSLCVGLATLGLLITSFDQFFGIQENHSLSGDCLIFLSLIPEASYYILSKLHPNRLPIFLISGIVNAINAIVLLPLVIFFVSLDAVKISAFGSMILIIVCMT